MFSLQIKQISTGIKLHGFVASSIGGTATWKKVNLRKQFGFHAAKICRETINRKSTKTLVNKKGTQVPVEFELQAFAVSSSSITSTPDDLLSLVFKSKKGNQAENS